MLTKAFCFRSSIIEAGQKDLLPIQARPNTKQDLPAVKFLLDDPIVNPSAFAAEDGGIKPDFDVADLILVPGLPVDISHRAQSPDWLLPTELAQASLLVDFLRRLFDIVISLALLVLMFPALLLIATMVKIDSPGPVVYRQDRVGLNGRTFVLRKFRSMRIDAEAGGPRWAAEHDPRVTRLGRWLRLTRLDELPQLVNVLVGEMSLVGPRPERPHFVEQIVQAMPQFTQRVVVKPGITGWAQVNYPYGATIEDAREKLAYDLYYIRNRKLNLDLKILVKTLFVVVHHKGAR